MEKSLVWMAFVVHVMGIPYASIDNEHEEEEEVETKFIYWRLHSSLVVSNMNAEPQRKGEASDRRRERENTHFVETNTRRTLLVVVVVV